MHSRSSNKLRRRDSRYNSHVVQFPTDHLLKGIEILDQCIQEQPCAQHSEFATLFHQKLCILQNPRKENEGRSKGRNRMNIEINVYQSLKIAVAMNLQLKLVFMEKHLFLSLGATQSTDGSAASLTMS